MLFIALTYSYGGVPTDRQAVIGAIVFLATYLMPLVVMALVLHRLPRRWRAGIDISLAGVFTFLALAMPGGVLAEGMALFFAVISIGASIDLLHLGGVSKGIGIFTLLLSALVLLLATGPAFVHALRSSHRY
jgi:hypothetical protein